MHVLEVEAVESAAVVGLLIAAEPVQDVVRRRQRDRLQLHEVALVVETRRGRVRTRITLEEIVDRAVFLDDDDDVLDRAGRTRVCAA